MNTHWKCWYWSFSSNTLATWCEEQTHWKRPWSWERLKAKGEEGSRRWDGWMASPIQWMWTWENSGRWWGTGRSGVLQSLGLQRIGYNLGTEQQQQWHAYKTAFDLNGILWKETEKKWKMHSKEIPQYINPLLSISSLRFCQNDKI